MNLSKTIKNIRASCNNYTDPDLVATIIHENGYMGTNNILEFSDYGIENDDDFEKRILKILNHEHVFFTAGMLTFIPIVNECDIYSIEDCTLKLTQEEFDKYTLEKERLFGILIKKDSTDFVIGTTDRCGCKIDASFKEIEKSDSLLYEKLKEIVDKLVIY